MYGDVLFEEDVLDDLLAQDKVFKAQGVLGFRFGRNDFFKNVFDDRSAKLRVKVAGVEGNLVVGGAAPLHVEKVAVKAFTVAVALLDNLAGAAFVAVEVAPDALYAYLHGGGKENRQHPGECRAALGLFKDSRRAAAHEHAVALARFGIDRRL
jgi:hypothetical protein